MQLQHRRFYNQTEVCRLPARQLRRVRGSQCSRDGKNAAIEDEENRNIALGNIFFRDFELQSCKACANVKRIEVPEEIVEEGTPHDPPQLSHCGGKPANPIQRHLASGMIIRPGGSILGVASMHRMTKGLHAQDTT